jgi:RimJ/RimL family protein N-acetyltransferase
MGNRLAFVYPEGFDPQPSLEGETLRLRPLRESDRAALRQAASDPLIWAGHPSSDRHESAVFNPYFDMLLGSGAALIALDPKDRVIGCSVFYTDSIAPSRLSIGFTFLTRDHWGGASNRAMKRLMLEHIFATSSEAWFHIGPSNIRSQMATTRLGAVFTHTADIDLGGGVHNWYCYCLTAENWAANDNEYRSSLG